MMKRALPECVGTRMRRMVLVLSLVLVAGCSTTGKSFRSAGLDNIVVGRTTLAQAAVDLGAQPVNVWQQGDSVLARWAYKGTIATDAVYFRQEVWLRFGSDGTFLRTENSINMPVQFHTRTAAEADREAAQIRARAVATSSTNAASSSATAAVGAEAAEAAPSLTIPVPPPPPVEPSAEATTFNAATTVPASPPAADPLLPAGTRVIPGVTYPLGGTSH